LAFDGIEVEIKVRVSHWVAEGLITRLERNGAAPIRQIDTYFDDPINSFIARQPIERWLSIRERGDNVLINHKLWHYAPSGHATYCDEAEVKANDAKAATTLLNALGYSPLITVDKTRTAGVIDTYEISVDQVTDLGYFVEVEATRLLTDLETTRKELESFAEGLGLDLSDTDYLGYPALLLQRL
jgi:adenylate cyclase class 2